MRNIISQLTPVLDFVRSNFWQIVVALSVAIISLLAFYITISSLKKLKYDIFSYYPFDKFFPQSGSWSILYFLIVIILLGGIVFLLAKGGFYLGPA